MIEICIIHFLGLTSGTCKLYALLKIHAIVMEISKKCSKVVSVHIFQEY